MCQYFTVDDLAYLERGGRVSKTAAAFGTALNIVPIMHLDYEGHLEVWQKVRGDKQCFKKVLKDIKELVENAGEQTLIVSEADAPEKAREYGAALVAECGFRDVFYTMQDTDVAGWVRSLQLRGIALPDNIKDEVFLIIGERRLTPHS